MTVTRCHDIAVNNLTDPAVLSYQNAARYLDVSPETIRRWAREGVLTKVKVRGAPRVTFSSVRCLLLTPEGGDDAA